MARPAPPIAGDRRRARADGRRGLAPRRDLEPVDLREGDPRVRRLRRGAARDGRRAARRPGDLRADGGQGRAAGVRRAARHVGVVGPPGRVRLARGGRQPCARRSAHDRGGARLLGARLAPERDDQDPRHDRGRGRDRAGDLRGHQRQRDAPVRRLSVRTDRRGVHPWARASRGGGQAADAVLGRELLRLTRRHGGRQAARGGRP